MGNYWQKPKIQEDESPNIFDAVATGQVDQLREYINEIPQFCDIRRNEKSLLQWAVLHNQVDCVELLLNIGMDANVSDKWGITPLMEVANSKSKDSAVLETMINLLISSGANINATNLYKRTVLMMSLVQQRNKIAEMLLNKNADTNIGDIDGLYPIHVCAKYSALSLLRLFLQQKGNINAQDEKGRTALYFAILAGHQNVVDELLQHSVDVNLGSVLGCPLQIAIVKYNYTFVGSLLHYGARVDFPVAGQMSKAKDCLNLALMVLHTGLDVLEDEQKKNRATNKATEDRLMRSACVLEMVIQAYGCKVNVWKSRFFSSGKPNFISSMPDSLLSRKLKRMVRQLVFLQAMGGNKFPIPGEGMPELESITDSRSLENLCRVKVREVLMRSKSNVVYAAKDLDCTPVAKDILLLKDIM